MKTIDFLKQQIKSNEKSIERFKIMIEGEVSKINQHKLEIEKLKILNAEYQSSIIILENEK